MKLDKNKKILIIDSSAYDYYVGVLMLQEVCDPLVATSVEDGIQHVREHVGNIQMIVLCLEGLKFMDILDVYFDLNKEFPKVIALTRDKSVVIMNRMLSTYGFFDVLLKPITREGLFSSMERLIEHTWFPFIERQTHDIFYFNQFADAYEKMYHPNKSLPRLKMDSLRNHVNTLESMKKMMEEQIEFPKAEKPHILFIDDERNIIEVYRDFVVDKPFFASFSHDIKTSLEIIYSTQIDLIILDLGLPDGHGIQLLKEIYKENPSHPSLPDVIVISSFFDRECIIEVMNCGGRMFLNKPIMYDKMLSLIYMGTFLRYCRQEFNINILTEKKESDIQLVIP